jgi:hypothetical protein
MKNLKLQNKYLKSNKGQALLTAVAVIGSILLSIITIAGYLSIKRVQISRTIVGSGAAIVQADAGIEQGLDIVLAQQYFQQHALTNMSISVESRDVTINKISTPTTACPLRGSYQIISKGSGAQGASIRAVELDLCE